MVRKIQDFIFINSEFFVYPLIRKIKTQKEYNRLFKNFLSLSVLQAANYIFPLIIFPYLVRVLGVEKFGLISFAQAFIMYFNVLVDYGFNLSATREISINRDNKEKVSEIFSSVMFIKFGLIMISLILLTIIVFSFEKFRVEWLIYYLTFGIVIGQAMFPVWLFQGLEEMRYITYVNVIAKGIFTLAVFVFVRNMSDYYKVPLLNSIGFITAGIISLVMVRKKFFIVFHKVDFEKIKYCFISSFHLFLSLASIPLFNQFNTFVLGVFTDNKIVGYYTIADKTVGLLIAAQSPLSNVIFPYVSNNIKTNFLKTMRFLKKLMLLEITGYLFIILFLYFYAYKIIPYIFGYDAINSVKLLKILLIIPLFVVVNNIYGNQILINIGRSDLYSKGFVAVAIINSIIIFPFVIFLKDIGASYSSQN